MTAGHQSGHNSGVVHAGIYYAPGSLRAKLCLEGLKSTYEYCDVRQIPYKKVGKLILATDDQEVPKLLTLFQRAKQNQVPNLQLLDAKEAKEIEPLCQCKKAIWSPETGIIDWEFVTKSYAEEFKQKNGEIFLNFKVVSIDSDQKDSLTITDASSNKIMTRFLISAAGLYSDKLAHMTGCPKFPVVVPVRGEYLLMKKGGQKNVRTNLYPVPDSRFPFLGVHFTPRMSGDVWLGPNAVLAFRREGYAMSAFSPVESSEMILNSGLQKLLLKNLRFGFNEMYKSINISAQVKELQSMMPSLQLSDVIRGPTGVRAQALDPEGNLIEDFVFDSGQGPNANRILHVRNAPSPAATSSLAIAKVISDTVHDKLCRL